MQLDAKNEWTPLMCAAMEAADETVSFLLSLGVSPDIICTGKGNKNALLAAIQSKCVTTINLLAPVTKENLGAALGWLAKKRLT